MTIVKFNVPFESLIEAITSLDLEKKREVLEILEDLVFESEESLEEELEVLAEIEEARKAYQKGNYQTIQEYIANQYQLGKLIYGTVEAHTPFGVFVNIGNEKVKGIIQITDFLDIGSMTPEMYPDIGSSVGAVVVGYTEDDRNQIWLSVKPSVLQKSLVKLKLPVANQL